MKKKIIESLVRGACNSFASLSVRYSVVPTVLAVGILCFSTPSHGRCRGAAKVNEQNDRGLDRILQLRVAFGK